MSKAFIAAVLQDSLDCSGVAEARGADALLGAIVAELQNEGSFRLPSFGTFAVRETNARRALNPRTGEPISIEAGRTVRFKISPMLKKAV